MWTTDGSGEVVVWWSRSARGLSESEEGERRVDSREAIWERRGEGPGLEEEDDLDFLSLGGGIVGKGEGVLGEGKAGSMVEGREEGREA